MITKKETKSNYKMIKQVIFSVVLLGSNIVLISQNQTNITQYMMHQPFFNDASMSSYNYINGAFLYKNQWVGLNGAPEVFALNINSPLKVASKSNLGVTVINDKIGVRDNIDLSFSYAYRIQVSKKGNLSFALSPMLRLLQADFSKVETDIDFDPTFLTNTGTEKTINFRFGTYYFTDKYYIGFSAPNLLRNSFTTNNESVETDFNINDVHLYLHGGYSFKLDNNYHLNASSLIKQVSASPTQIDINLQIEYQKKVSLGFIYRTSKEIATLFSINIKQSVKLAYAYDYPFGDINEISSGSHEIMLIFSPTNNKNLPSITAPRF